MKRHSIDNTLIQSQLNFGCIFMQEWPFFVRFSNSIIFIFRLQYVVQYILGIAFHALQLLETGTLIYSSTLDTQFYRDVP